MKKPKVMVVLSGGLIQNVYVDRDMDVVICDFDTDGCMEEDEHGKETDVPMLTNVYKDEQIESQIVSEKFYKAMEDRWKFQGELSEEDEYAIKKLKELDF